MIIHQMRVNIENRIVSQYEWTNFLGKVMN